MYYRPPRALGLLVGAVISLWAAAVALLLLDSGLSADVGAAVVRLLRRGGGRGRAGAAVRVLDVRARHALLRAGPQRPGDRMGADATGDPLGAIERLVPGTSLGMPRVSGVSWWGHHVGKARIERIGDVLFYSAHQAPEQVLYVMTAERNYAISVDDPAAFAQEIQVRQELGAHRRGDAPRRAHRRCRTGLLERPPGAGAGAAGDRGRCAALAAAGPPLRGPPATLELYFPPTRPQPIVTVVSRDAIFELPRTASLMLGVNLVVGAGALLVGPRGRLRGVHRRRRRAGRLLRRHRHRPRLSAADRSAAPS